MDEEKKGEYYDKTPKFLTDGHSKFREQLSKGFGSFLIIASGIVFYFLFLRFGDIFKGLGNIIGILKPVLYGFVIAYLLNPIVKWVERHFVEFVGKKLKKPALAKKLSRGAGIVTALVVMFVFFVLLFNMIIPELITSVRGMIYTVPKQLNEFIDKISLWSSSSSAISTFVDNALTEATEYFRLWMQQDLLTQINAIMSDVTVGVLSIFSELFNIIIGIIISIYVLVSKEVFAGQSKKIIYALFPTRNANIVLHITQKSNEIFGGFIIGKLIDSLIIGLICFICLSILNMPYTLLVSVIIGVTNIIPFFGPYIGAVPSAILILLQNPTKGIWFIIFIIILQQIDGNIIGPKILGDSTGVSAFWVVFAILLGGGLFGFVGMIIGVPTFAVIYYIVGLLINQRLEKKKLPTLSEEYNERSYVDSVTGSFVHGELNAEFEKKEKKIFKKKRDEEK